MIRIVLRILNTPILLLATILAIAIQTSLFATYPFTYIQPDVVLLVVIWCALRRSFFEGGVLTLILGNVAEIHSAAPQGLLMLTYMLVYLGVRAAARLLVIPHFSSLILLTMAASIASKAAYLVVLYLMGAAGNQWQPMLIYLFPGAMMAGLLGFWTFRGLDRFDWVTFKNIRARQALEDELRLEGEGL